MINDVVNLSFEDLIRSIRNIHEKMRAQTNRAVNAGLTLRNWIIGFYIVEYEQKGSDRAKYGSSLIENLSEELAPFGIVRCEPRELRRYRLFYSAYPQIRDSLSPELNTLLTANDLGHAVSRISSITPDKANCLLLNLSFSHFNELITIEDVTKRNFYETECIKGNWSVRELKRQIGSLYFERSTLSKDKKKLSDTSCENSEKNGLALTIRDPYVFEFLGIKPKEVMAESELENQLIDKLEEFLLEMGHGFCFEARQKRILIGDEQFFVDLVFYQRILKCHILVELKLERFKHENIGQLNTYVSWYRENMMTDGDNPPVGILLCTDKNEALVKYALAGMDNHLFVSKYLLELPGREEMQKFIEDQIKR